MMAIIPLLLLSFVTVCYSGPLNQPDNCDQGPTYWCKNKHTARECDVAEFCEIKEHMGKLSPVEKGTAAPPVNVSLYYESLCPGCRAMIMNQIFPTYQTLKSTGILNIHLYPYGNAYEQKNGQLWEFNCQHGAQECRVNLIETCALHLVSPHQMLPFIHCIEQSPSVQNGKKCAETLDIEWDPIYKCYNGSQGNYLEHEMAVATDNLKPTHQYVPWITVNGVHTNEIQDKVTEGMLAYVCSLYQGTKPAQCAGTKLIKTQRSVNVCNRE